MPQVEYWKERDQLMLSGLHKTIRNECTIYTRQFENLPEYVSNSESESSTYEMARVNGQVLIWDARWFYHTS